MGAHAERHTGPVTLTGSALAGGWQFEQPDGTIFVINASEWTRPALYEGEKFLDVIYADAEGKHISDFVRAKKDPSSPKPPEKAAEGNDESVIYYYQGGTYYACPQVGFCAVGNTTSSTYPLGKKKAKK